MPQGVAGSPLQRSGEAIAPLLAGAVAEQWLNIGQAARRYADAMDVASMIEMRPGVRSGKPCFVGTRITVYDVLDYLASGMSADEILSDFPELTREHVQAALEFAALRERRLASA